MVNQGTRWIVNHGEKEAAVSLAKALTEMGAGIVEVAERFQR
jgi:hypothetical protein